MKSLLLFKKIRFVFISKKKKKYFDLSKYQICFVYVEKSGFWRLKKFRYDLLHKIKSKDKARST